MSLTRQQKEERVSEAVEVLSSGKAVAFMAYNELNVNDMEELRNQAFAGGMRVRVIPKRLLRLALQEAGLEFDPSTVEGQIAFTWGDDTVAPAKTISEFIKEREQASLVAGVMDGAMLSSEEVQALAKLPSAQELAGQLVSVLAGPMRGFVTALSGTQRNLVYALSAIKDQKDS